MSIINLLANNRWSEADIVNHGRAVIASQVPEERQNELRTIMLGHIAGMRTATPDEMAEIVMVKQATEAQAVSNAAARADMALLQSVLDYEAAVEQLSYPPLTLETNVGMGDYAEDGTLIFSHPPQEHVDYDTQERAKAQAVIDAATPEVLALYALRHPLPAIEPEIVE